MLAELVLRKSSVHCCWTALTLSKRIMSRRPDDQDGFQDTSDLDFKVSQFNAGTKEGVNVIAIPSAMRRARFAQVLLIFNVLVVVFAVSLMVPLTAGAIPSGWLLLTGVCLIVFDLVYFSLLIFFSRVVARVVVRVEGDTDVSEGIAGDEHNDVGLTRPSLHAASIDIHNYNEDNDQSRSDCAGSVILEFWPIVGLRALGTKRRKFALRDVAFCLRETPTPQSSCLRHCLGLGQSRMDTRLCVLTRRGRLYKIDVSEQLKGYISRQLLTQAAGGVQQFDWLQRAADFDAAVSA